MARFRAGRAAAFLWGLVEATFFFVVPDVLLSRVAQKNGVRPALVAASFTVAGACLGGFLMWRFGRDDPAAARTFLDAVPAISPAMLVQAGVGLRDSLVATLFAGAFSGVPYKIYAALAPAAGIGWPEFLLASIPARACRFVIVVLATAGADRLAARWLDARRRFQLLLAGWTVFYAAFWTLMPN